MHYVYKFVKDGQILYIGKSDAQNFDRIKSHGKSGDNIPEKYWEEINSADIFYIITNNKTLSDVVESELIRRYHPLFNKAKQSEWTGIPFQEPEWIGYRINGEYTHRKTKKPKPKKQKHETKQNPNSPYTNRSLSQTHTDLFILLGLEVERTTDQYKKAAENASNYYQTISNSQYISEELKKQSLKDKFDMFEKWNKMEEIQAAFFRKNKRFR